MIFPGEKEATRKCCELGAKFGYGNLMHRMKAAWALNLLEKYDMSVEAACGGALMSKEEVKGLGIMDKKDAIKWLKDYCFEE